VLLTGATGGLGWHFARRLARERCRLILTAFPGEALAKLEEDLRQVGVQTTGVVCDLRNPDEVGQLLAEANRVFGQIDVLINNAGIEFTSSLHELSAQDLAAVLAVNLHAPMRLAQLVVPGMLARRWGHIVNVSSLAGRSGPAFQEPYAATKAGLVAFTQSLRGSYRGSGVSASVVCPGFVQTGIYARLVQRSGCVAPWLLAPSRPERVAEAVVRAIQRDRPEVIINRWPIRPLLAVTALFPRWGERFIEAVGSHAYFRRAHAALRQRGR
jgi:short-subunit dehydrogenase